MLHIRSCLNFLENEDVSQAYGEYKKVPTGGMGCFNDRLIEPARTNESESYVNGVFEALVYYWWQSMESVVVKTPNKRL